MPRLRVLLTEDDHAYAGVVSAELASSPVELRHAVSLHAARRMLADEPFDAMLLDLNLPDSSGLDTVEAAERAAPDVPIVVLTSTAGDETALLAVQRGAQDYLLKHEVDGPAVLRALRYAIERASLRRSISESEARFRALVEHGYDAITLIDAGGTIMFDSHSIGRVMGYSPDERVGHPFQEYLHPEDVEPITERFRYCLDHPHQILRIDYRFRHKDGSWRHGEASGINHLDTPSIRAIIVNHRDVTDRVAMEQALRKSEVQLRQAQKMEAVGRLAGGVAHDFNNVLTAIFGYTDLLIDQFSADDPRRADVLEIRRSAERAAALTRQLLAFSRKQVIQPRTLNLNTIIMSVEKLLGRLVGDEIELEYELDPRLGSVRADPGQIEQVLMNLAANARDAMPEGGRVTIVTRNARVLEPSVDRPGLNPGEYALLLVSDTGIGMSGSVAEHIFEPFFTTKEQGKGTGLGLSTVYAVVKQSGGTVYVETEEGKGTTFSIYLPLVGIAAPDTVPRS